VKEGIGGLQALMGALEAWFRSTHTGCLLPLMLQGKILDHGVEIAKERLQYPG